MAIDLLPEPLRTAAHLRWPKPAPEREIMRELRCRGRRVYYRLRQARERIVALLLA